MSPARARPKRPKFGKLRTERDNSMADDEPDDDTLAAFTKILTKVGPKWLTEQMKTSTPSAGVSSDKPPGLSLETFLQDTLKETRAILASTTERMERMRDLLTPEQLTQLRSPASPSVATPRGEESGQPNSTRPTAPVAASPPSNPGKALKKRWL